MLHKEYQNFIENNVLYAKELLMTLGKIPSPSNHEEKRAEFIKNWFHEIGAKEAYIDDALNVICPCGINNSNSLIIFMAHTDVVFQDTEELPMKQEDNYLYCPGIGDDTANLVGLLMTAKYVFENKLTPKDGKGFLFIANSGEEGLGNLKGSRKIYNKYQSRIEFLCSFDGYMPEICNTAVGSERYKVEVKTEGGHSYSHFGNRNAIAYIASMINTLYEIKPPVSNTRTTYNVGAIKGGTSINSIAQQAEMLYEYRSDSKKDLDFMRNHFNSVIEAYRAKGIGVNVTMIGERPCSGEVNKEKLLLYTSKAINLIKEITTVKPMITSMSTDCNIPLSHGIPSVCIGVIKGSGAHTREEFIELDSMKQGYMLAMEYVLQFFETK